MLAGQDTQHLPSPFLGYVIYERSLGSHLQNQSCLQLTSCHSSMVSTAACYRGLEVPASNPGKGKNLLISDLKGNLII